MDFWSPEEKVWSHEKYDRCNRLIDECIGIGIGMSEGYFIDDAAYTHDHKCDDSIYEIE